METYLENEVTFLQSLETGPYIDFSAISQAEFYNSPSEWFLGYVPYPSKNLFSLYFHPVGLP